MKRKTIFNRVLVTVLTIAALLTGQNAWAQSKFTISAPTHNSSTHVTSFIVTRTTNTSTSEQVNYCTVSLSAIAGQHFTDKKGQMTFDASHNELTVVVTETPDAIDEQYHFQTGTSRSYRLVIFDKNGFQLASRDRDIDYGNTYLHSDSYVNKSITDLVYFQSGSVKSGSDNKYLDVAHSGTNGTEKMIDDGYDYNDNTLCTVSTNSLYNSSSALRTYLARSYNDYKMYATVYFQQREVDDGYQYIQILADNATTYDGKDDDGKIDNGPTKSLYKAAFILTKNENVCTNWKYQAFPHKSDDHTSSTEFDYSDSYLYAQKFQSSDYRATTSGSLVLDPTVNDINVRFDANGGGDDTWYLKNLKVRLALVDTKAPTVLDNYKVSDIIKALGANIYVSVPFSEIVKVTGTPKLNTTWGELSYCFGDGSNVLTFSGNISSDALGQFTVNSYSGTIKDLAGNQLNTAGNTIYHEFGISLTSSSPYNITYDLDGGTVSVSNPTSYTYETASITLNNPTRFGYYFDGWTGSNGSTPQTTVTIAQHSHGNKRYTANWTKVWTGSGTQGEPYIINSTKGLDLLAQYVNSGNDCSGVYFQLGGNIEYSHTTDWNNADSEENNYTAIGTDSYPFSGIFDGKGYTVSGIRIYKGGNTESDRYQGLFGKMNSGTVKRVNLSDARITGFRYTGGIAGTSIICTIEDCTVGADVCIHAVQNKTYYHGGIVGFNQNGPVSRCISCATLSVADGKTDCYPFGGIASYTYGGTITDCIADGVVIPDVSGRGAIVGYDYSGTFTRNYYHNCKVASDAVTPSGVGMGTQGSTATSDPDGAQPLYALALPEHVSIVRTPATDPLPGTNMTYDNGADINGVPYAKGSSVVNLSYDPATITDGYDVLLSVKQTSDNTAVSFADNGNHTYTIASMPAADITVTATEIPFIAYIDADGNPQSHACTPIVDGTFTQYLGAAGCTNWYVVSGEVSTKTLEFKDATTNIILCDGATLSISVSQSLEALCNYKGSINIFAQSGGTGAINVTTACRNGIYANNSIDINGGVITVSNASSSGIWASNGDVTIRRGHINVLGSSHALGAKGNVNILGGIVNATGGSGKSGIIAANATLTLGCSSPTDRIYASSYKAYYNDVRVADGQILSDGTDTYSGTLNSDEIAEIAGKTLSTAIPYIDADGTTKYKASHDLTFITTRTINYGNAANAEGWYCVNSNVTFDEKEINFKDQLVNIILCDGATMSAQKTTQCPFTVNNGSVAIYGQTLGTGTLTANSRDGRAIYAEGNIDFNGGTINASSLYYIGIYAYNNITIRRGNITAKGGSRTNGYGFKANGTITLGCATTADHIYATSYSGTVTIAKGQTLTDGISANIYTDTLTNDQMTTIKQKTMMKALGDISYIDENGQEQTCSNYNIISDGMIRNDAGSGIIGTNSMDIWYVASGNYILDKRLKTIGRIHLILCDGATFTVNSSDNEGINANDNLCIYGQSQGTGTLTVNVASASGKALYVNYRNLVVNGGVINANGGAYGIYINNGSMTVNGGTINATGTTSDIYAGVRFEKVNGIQTANFSGTSLGTVHIPSAITVREVIYNRTFTAGKASTVMLPFDYTCNGSEGGSFYRFVGVEQEGNTWVATMQSTADALTANTPYLFMPTGTSITFTIPNEGVTLCTKGGGDGQTADAGSHWTFKGTYEYKEWIADGANSAEIGTVYGFAGVAKDGINVGDFVKVASGAKIRPMSAYLIWSNTANLAPARGGMNAASASADKLPQSITVRLLGADGTVTNVGQIDMETGEVSFEGWYTLQGVKLDAEPTEPGIYINNGKKVSIK